MTIKAHFYQNTVKSCIWEYSCSILWLRHILGVFPNECCNFGPLNTVFFRLLLNQRLDLQYHKLQLDRKPG